MNQSIYRLINGEGPYGRTFTHQDFVNKVQERHAELDPEWFVDGIDCEALAPGQPWKRGKIVISLQFVPAPKTNASAPKTNLSDAASANATN